jgi:hypothetical protein
MSIIAPLHRRAERHLGWSRRNAAGGIQIECPWVGIGTGGNGNGAGFFISYQGM